MKECLLYMSLICCQPQNHLSALKVNNTWCYAVTLPVCVTANDLTHIPGVGEGGRKRERDGKKRWLTGLHWARGQTEVTFVFIPHSSPINLLGGDPSPAVWQLSLSLSLFLWRHQSLASGRGGTGILKPAAWQLSFFLTPSPLRLSLTQSPVRYL